MGLLATRRRRLSGVQVRMDGHWGGSWKGWDEISGVPKLTSSFSTFPPRSRSPFLLPPSRCPTLTRSPPSLYPPLIHLPFLPFLACPSPFSFSPLRLPLPIYLAVSSPPLLRSSLSLPPSSPLSSCSPSSPRVPPSLSYTSLAGFCLSLLLCIAHSLSFPLPPPSLLPPLENAQIFSLTFPSPLPGDPERCN